jgi:hypothetical protein
VAGEGAPAIAIGVPARDEELLIGPCLEALAEQRDAPPFSVVLVLNNCRDKTAELARQMGPRLPYALHVFEVELPRAKADAAWARRLAVNAACGLAGRGGRVLTTDADSRADSGWVRALEHCFAEGADVVCGFVAPDFSDAPPLDFESVRRGAMEFEYSQLTAELRALIDPDPYDPWPSHMIETGANLAVLADTVLELGGIPHVCPGEDERFVRMAERAGKRVRHAFLPSVTTSSRLRGRAEGGWSDFLQDRVVDGIDACHEKLEPARFALRRALLRAQLRKVHATADFAAMASRYAASPDVLAQADAAARFEGAWAILQQAPGPLARRTLTASTLEANANQLRTYVEKLREHQRASLAKVS